jgi:GNAT superfamily N-acetyltransferase
MRLPFLAMPISIRPATPEDHPRIVGFNQSMARETEGRELDAAVVAAGVARLLQTPEFGFYLIAEVDGETAGCLMITYEWSDWRNALFWWIQSVYVEPGFRRRGVYRALHGFVRSMAETRDSCGLRLYVEKNNNRAQRTYSTLGMGQTHYKMFEELF